MSSFQKAIAKVPTLPFLTPEIEEKAFIGGYEAITVEITSPAEDGVLYAESFKHDPVQFTIKLKNEGESPPKEYKSGFDPGKGYLCLVNLPSIFSDFGYCDCRSFYLKGAYLDNQKKKVEGGDTTISYEQELIPDLERDYKNLVVTTSARYNYESYTFSKALIKKIDKQAFEPVELAFENSGSPLHVTSIKESLVPKDGLLTLYLDIDVEHVGEGNLLGLRARKDSCDIAKNDFIDVSFRDSPPNADCRPLYMKDDKGEIRCTIRNIEPPIELDDYYLDLTLIFSYVYEVTDSNVFEVMAE